MGTELAQAQYGLVTRRQLEELSLHRRSIQRRIQDGLLLPVYPGVLRLAGTPESWRQSLMAACLWGAGCLPERWPRGSAAAVSHRAAAALHGLSGFAEEGVEIICSKPAQFTGAGFTVHRSTPDPRFSMLVDRIPVTNPARTLIDLAAVLPAGGLERALDDALRRYLVTEKHLRWAIGGVDGYGRRGAGALAALLDGRAPDDGPSASVFQKGLRRLVLGARLPFVEEFPVPGTRYRVDLGNGEYLVGVEGDSAKHHSSPEDWRRDLERRNTITATGFTLVHFTPTDLKERPEWIIETISATLRRAGWPGPPVRLSAAGARSRTG
jgi:very-short-patch-repair endonuclease